MTMFDKVVATDLAALGRDSRQRMGSLVAMMPKPAPIVVEPAVNPACARANRVAGMAAGIAAIGCGAALAVLPSRPLLVAKPYDVQMPSITTNVWMLGFIAVATVAVTFLVAHRIALRRSPESVRRARGVGDLVFGSVAIAWVVTWFVVGWHRKDMPELFFDGRNAIAWKTVLNDEHVHPVLVIAGGLAVALAARCIAVSLANHVSDRWRGSSITVLVKITAITLLVTVFGLCVFDTDWAGQWGWQPMMPSRSGGWAPQGWASGPYAHWKMVHTLNLVVREYKDPLSDTQWATLYVIGTMTVLGAILALACARERYMKVPSRWLIAIEHAMVIPLAAACVFVSLLRLGWSRTEPSGVVYPPLLTTIALVTILVSSTLRRRRAQLTPSTPVPSVSSPVPRPSP
jgi:hypothetical protein